MIPPRSPRAAWSLIVLGVLAPALGCDNTKSEPPPGPPPDVDSDFPIARAAGLAATPPMGWNSWNKFTSNVSEPLLKATADGMVSSGMRDAGYVYVNIDDTWSVKTRAADGSLQADPVKFPSGMKALADYVHGKGLKLGIYGDRGTLTCAGYPGSLGYEAQDAMTFASWGIDYLKYDNCSADAGTMQTDYAAMSDAIAAATQATGQSIVYSLCAWQFYEWGVGVGQLWRTTGDIKDAWTSTYGNILTTQALGAYAGPNGWNDPDMLEVGVMYPDQGGMTLDEYRSHFSLWALASAPLIAGNDLRDGHLPDEIRAILTNAEVIALDQDPLGLQGALVRNDSVVNVWAKPLDANGARGVVLLNASDGPVDITVAWGEIGLRAGSASVRDLWAGADLGSFSDSYTATAVASHASVVLEIVGDEPAKPTGSNYLSDLTWTYATNGLGPVLRDQAADGSDPPDGRQISIGGTTYAKGLGVSAPSAVVFRLAQGCTSFTADIGIDDASRGGGSVVFQVWADDPATPSYASGTKLFDSGLMDATAPVQPVQIDVTGRRRLRLLVTNGGDGPSFDRASWGNAKIECASP